MKKAAWGPFGDIKEFVGTVATVIAIIVAAKFMDKYGISTWGDNRPPKKKKEDKHPKEEP